MEGAREMSLSNNTLIKWYKAMKKDVRGKIEFKYVEFLEWMATVDLINALEIDDTRVNEMELDKLKVPEKVSELIVPAAVKLQLGLTFTDLRTEEKYRYKERTIEEKMMKGEAEHFATIGSTTRVIKPIDKDSTKFNEISEAIAATHGWKDFKQVSELRQEVTLSEDMYCRIGYGDMFIAMDGKLPLYLDIKPFNPRKLTLTLEEVETEFYDAIRLTRIKK